MTAITKTGGIPLLLNQQKHSQLIKMIIGKFRHSFAPKSDVLYTSGVDFSFLDANENRFMELGVKVQICSKMPDVLLYYPPKNRLFLVETITNHGPVDVKRRNELAELFKHCSAALIYVTAFFTRSEMARYLSDISWETEVWVAESPTHLIHFNGVRFLGPYE